MARKQPPSAPSTPPAEDSIERLTQTVSRLIDEVQVLRQTIDEFREAYDWALKHQDLRPPVWPGLPLTSLPKDPLDPHFGEKINRRDGKTPPGPDSNHPVHTTQAELF